MAGELGMENLGISGALKSGALKSGALKSGAFKSGTLNSGALNSGALNSGISGAENEGIDPSDAAGTGAGAGDSSEDGCKQHKKGWKHISITTELFL